MKINLSEIDLEQFSITPGEIADETCYLVQPKKISCQWNTENLHFRSSIWNSQGELVSAGLPKFFNWGEANHIQENPTTLRNINLLEKCDGSSLIISQYHGELIIRTRGTFSAYNLKNGHEIDTLRKKYPLLSLLVESQYGIDGSIIFEWVSPANPIVIKYPEPDLYLIGIINHEDYSLEIQKNLDEIAKECNFKRPQRFNFNSIPEMLTAIESLQDQEGICIYYNFDQNIKKLKSLHYLKLHAFKSEISLSNLLDLYFEYKQPNFTIFLDNIRQQFDHECSQAALPFISKICQAAKEVNNIIDGMMSFILALHNMSRKDQAARILSAYGNTNRASYVFGLLDGKELKQDSLKKLFFQVLK